MHNSNKETTENEAKIANKASEDAVEKNKSDIEARDKAVEEKIKAEAEVTTNPDGTHTPESVDESKKRKFDDLVN